MTYLAPEGEGRVELRFKRSRFIGIVRNVTSPAEASSARLEIRRELEDATHHCWACVLGDPKSSPAVRFDDAGEPSGTAGKPILNVLMRRNLGDVLLVVVRYFGGIKLGTGGLHRAYSATASAALDVTTLRETTATRSATIVSSFEDEKQVRRALEEMSLTPTNVEYGAEVVISLEVHDDRVDSLRRSLSEKTRGRAVLGLRIERNANPPEIE
ncbi:MAG TPA: YigZ family protein [Vicinamibacteria bacterium]|nr:YigZ family protein [Vicinamibacteria bacterium]